MKFSELQRLQRREGLTVLSADERIEQLEARLRAVTKERDALHAHIERMEKQEPVATVDANDEGYWAEILPDRSVLVGQKLYSNPGAQPAPSVPIDSIGKLLTQAMDVAVANGANSVSMPDELVEVAAWLQGIPAEQIAPSVPDGWQLVPCRMTDAMLRAARDAWLDDPMRRTTTMWGAALDAAPRPEGA